LQQNGTAGLGKS